MINFKLDSRKLIGDSFFHFSFVNMDPHLGGPSHCTAYKPIYVPSVLTLGLYCFVSRAYIGNKFVLIFVFVTNVCVNSEFSYVKRLRTHLVHGWSILLRKEIVITRIRGKCNVLVIHIP